MKPTQTLKVFTLKKLYLLHWRNELTSVYYFYMHTLVAVVSFLMLLPLGYFNLFTLTTTSVRYDNLCPALNAYCYFNFNITTAIKANSVGFIYLRGLSQSNKR